MQRDSRTYQAKHQLSILTPTGLQAGKIIVVDTQTARIAGLRNVKRGDKLRLCVLDHLIEGQVNWALHGWVALSFNAAIAPVHVAALQPTRHGLPHIRSGSLPLQATG